MDIILFWFYVDQGFSSAVPRNSAGMPRNYYIFYIFCELKLYNNIHIIYTCM